MSHLASDGVHLQHPHIDARPIFKHLCSIRSAIHFIHPVYPVSNDWILFNQCLISQIITFYPLVCETLVMNWYNSLIFNGCYQQFHKIIIIIIDGSLHFNNWLLHYFLLVHIYCTEPCQCWPFAILFKILYKISLITCIENIRKQRLELFNG